MADAKEKQLRAVALKFKMGSDAAPQILAKGRGKMAERIMSTAQEHKIPLYEDPELVEILAKLDMGHEIPPELYQAVAEVLIFIYRMNQQKLKNAPPGINIPIPGFKR